MNMPLTLEKSVVDAIGDIGELRRPAEACGVLLPFPWKGRQVFEMPNRSKKQNDSFALLSDDVTMTLQDWIADHPDSAVWENITIWHTHPSGGVGPSKEDMDNRIEVCGNLVVALTEDGPKATWF